MQNENVVQGVAKTFTGIKEAVRSLLASTDTLATSVSLHEELLEQSEADFSVQFTGLLGAFGEELKASFSSLHHSVATLKVDIKECLETEQMQFADAHQQNIVALQAQVAKLTVENEALRQAQVERHTARLSAKQAMLATIAGCVDEFYGECEADAKALVGLAQGFAEGHTREMEALVVTQGDTLGAFDMIRSHTLSSISSRVNSIVSQCTNDASVPFACGEREC